MAGKQCIHGGHKTTCRRCIKNKIIKHLDSPKLKQVKKHKKLLYVFVFEE